MRILVVDDDDQVGSAIARVLRVAYDVTLESTVSAAQRTLDDDVAFHIIVSDVYAPDGSGIDLYEWVLGRSPELAANMVFVTGGASDRREARMLSALPNLRVGKPFGARELREVVDAVAARIRRAPSDSPS